ncbi:MAG TPA: erythromycin esterase family protein [Rhizomicrobium sp.]|jgi:erythromycin esterase-like protein|nr:erythromycin esterase family protein [Rhizomicrobium sp.]
MALLEKVRSHDSHIVDLLKHYGEPLPAPDTSDFGAAFERFGHAKVVLLGEATHGTSEFYCARAAISRALIKRHGFNIVAAEADWPDAARVDRFIRHKSPEPSAAQAFARFPTWMWRNVQAHDFVLWLRAHNERLRSNQRVEFRGLDIYSLGSSIAAVLAYLDKNDPEGAKEARRRYGCLTPWQDEPARYGHAVLYGRKPCEPEVVAQLQDLLNSRLDRIRHDGEAFFDAAQNARIVRAAEQYYRIMYEGSRESWNLRDRHMFDTLQHLMSARTDAKAIVWAHNSHIGNAAATSMGWEGEFNIGELCRTAYGDEAVAIGFGTDRGTVAAADDWDEPMRVKNVLPARDDSYERLFRDTRISRSLTDWRPHARADLREALSQPRTERAIGVVYRPETEYLSHYFKAVLAEQFDALVWFEETRAVTPLGPEHARAMPETYPFGL